MITAIKFTSIEELIDYVKKTHCPISCRECRAAKEPKGEKA